MEEVALRKKSNLIMLAVVVVIVVLLLIPALLGQGVSHEEAEELGHLLPLWSCIPFVGMLLSIAIVPLVKPHWWEKNLFKVAIAWSLVFLVPFAIAVGPAFAGFEFVEMMALDYLPFIVLLWGLFAVAGGLVLRGSLSGSPKVNVILLLVGTLLASWIGTTGASMVMIRPLLRANKWREKKAHSVVFFIFLVSNIGGSLTPIGDPPLFLGFLRGVPFFWTMRLLPLMAFNAVLLLVVYFLIDSRLYKKEIAAGRAPEAGKSEKLRLDGAHNLIFLLMIVGAVILSGVLQTVEPIASMALPLPYGLELAMANVIQIIIIVVAGFLSIKTTKKELHEANHFTWGPIQEVACLFTGIFLTMIPALAILNARGGELGLTQNWQFFWATGALSSFLDNAPTYLVFMTTAGSLGIDGLSTAVGTIAPSMLIAISAGAVFMGANTYIGNAPNFMVRSIAEENGVKMPSFFGYMGWSARFLIPLFIVDTVIFFLLMYK
jgi:Na+/H+ antiporter NhaD/arsenite permease-like protein